MLDRQPVDLNRLGTGFAETAIGLIRYVAVFAGKVSVFASARLQPGPSETDDILGGRYPLDAGPYYVVGSDLGIYD